MNRERCGRARGKTEHQLTGSERRQANVTARLYPVRRHEVRSGLQCSLRHAAIRSRVRSTPSREGRQRHGAGPPRDPGTPPGEGAWPETSPARPWGAEAEAAAPGKPWAHGGCGRPRSGSGGGTPPPRGTHPRAGGKAAAGSAPLSPLQPPGALPHGGTGPAPRQPGGEGDLPAEPPRASSLSSTPLCFAPRSSPLDFQTSFTILIISGKSQARVPC